MRSGVEGGRCPHCKAEVPKDHGRLCIECGGSLQKRYLSIGCLTSKPLILIAAGLSMWLAGGEDAPAADAAALAERAAELTVERTVERTVGRADANTAERTGAPRDLSPNEPDRAGIAAPR